VTRVGLIKGHVVAEDGSRSVALTSRFDDHASSFIPFFFPLSFPIMSAGVSVLRMPVQLVLVGYGL